MLCIVAYGASRVEDWVGLSGEVLTEYIFVHKGQRIVKCYL